MDIVVEWNGREHLVKVEEGMRDSLMSAGYNVHGMVTYDAIVGPYFIVSHPSGEIKAVPYKDLTKRRPPLVRW